MAIAFPTSPTDGQEFSAAGRYFIYRATPGVWESADGPDASQEVYVQDATPTASESQPYIWIQTGLSDDGFTVWFNDPTL